MCSMFRWHGYEVSKLVSIGWPFLLRNHSNEASRIWQTILILHCIYLMNILRQLPAKLDHIYLIGPCRAKNLTFELFFNNYETVRRRYPKLYFFWIAITRGSVSITLDNIEATFEFDPCTIYLVTPRLPVQDVTRQQYEIVILGPLPT